MKTKEIKTDDKIIVHFDLIDEPIRNEGKGVIIPGEAYLIDNVDNSYDVNVFIDTDMYLDILNEKNKKKYDDYYFTNCIFGKFYRLKQDMLDESSYIEINQGILCARNDDNNFKTIRKFNM